MTDNLPTRKAQCHRIDDKLIKDNLDRVSHAKEKYPPLMFITDVNTHGGTVVFNTFTSSELAYVIKVCITYYLQCR